MERARETAAIGVIGAGAIARTVHLPVLTATPETSVAFVADADGRRAAEVAAAFGVPHVPLERLPQVLPGCEAVLLAIPVSVRAPYLAMLSAAGVTALVEKPFARTVAEHEAALQAFPPHRLACGFMRRTYAATRLARRILEEGWLGPPRRLRAAEGGRTTKTGVDASPFDRGTAGGVLLDLGCHALDLAFHLTGARGHQVVRAERVLDGPVDRRAEGEVLLLRNGEAPLPLQYVFSWLDPQEDCLEIEFDTARLRLHAKPERPLTLGGKNLTGEVPLVDPAAGATTSAQAFYLEWRLVLDAARAGTPSPLAAASCLPLTALLEELHTR